MNLRSNESTSTHVARDTASRGSSTASARLLLIRCARGAFGDVGYCAPFCACNDECAHPQSICDAFTQDAVRDLVAASGVCAPIYEESEGLACTD
jgi:hypothetical protein